MHLLDFAPPNLSLILTSRTRPRLPLSRLRVRRQLTEVDADTLRFDLDETRAFLVDLNGLRLDGDDVARLSEGTDGWVAALQLVSLSLRDCADPTQLIRGFSGRHHSVGEYLAENVLSAQPPEILEFLLATSVCDRLCGDLAGRLADRADGQAMLEELERRDLFLRPLDDEREWFRYHHLFADYLRRRLERDHPERVPRLHRRASNWFSEHDLVSEAVTHALAAGTVERATDLVERHAMPLVEHSRMVSLLGLTARLPAAAVDGRPRLLMAVAWANCLLQRADAAQHALDHLRRAMPVGGAHEEMHSEADVVQACIDVYGDRIDRAEALVRKSLARHRTYRPWVVAVAANIQTFCDIYSMRYRAALERQRWARPFHDRTIGPFSGVYGRCFAGVAAFAQLDLDAAEEHLRGAVVLARESAGRRSHAAQLAGALLGELHYERGELDEAERLLEESRELGAESGVVDFMIASYAVLARIKAHRGADAEAAELLAEGAKVAERLDLTAAVRRRRRRTDPRSSWPRGGCARPAGWRRTCPTARPAPAGSAWSSTRSAPGRWPRCCPPRATTTGAAALLEELIGDLRRPRPGPGRGDGDGRARRRAGTRGAPDHRGAHARRGAGAGGARGAAADRRRRRPEVTAVAHRLVERWPAGAPPVPGLAELLARVAPAKDTSGLNGRELAILRMLDAGRSNPQIARELTVTVNTVKWYLKNIYAKLGATNRAEAVSTARRGGLL